MQKIVLVSFICILFFISPAFAGGKTDRDASRCAVDSIIQYYKAMTMLAPEGTATADYRDRLSYFKQNKDYMVSQVARTRTYHHLGRAHQICENMYLNKTMSHAYGKVQNRVEGPAYFDAFSGHRYIRKNKDTYAEYSRDGRLIKTVPATLPLLSRRDHVFLITGDSYILYKKYEQGKKNYQSLPGSRPHPQGWKAEKFLISLN